MARGELILRQWNLLKMLQTRGEGITLRDIAGDLDVSERTIQRDFEVLQELGFPIDFEEDEGGKRFWHLPADFFRSGALVLGITEAVMATFQLGNTVEFKRWIKGFGVEAEVVRPDWLRCEIRDELFDAARLYETNP